MKVRIPKIKRPRLSLLKLVPAPRRRARDKKAMRIKELDAQAHERRQAILKQHRQSAVPPMTAEVVSRPLAVETTALPQPAATVALAISKRPLATKPASKAPSPAATLRTTQKVIAAPPPTIAQSLPSIQQSTITQTTATSPYERRQPAGVTPTNRTRQVRAAPIQRFGTPTSRSSVARATSGAHSISRSLSLDGMRG